MTLPEAVEVLRNMPVREMRLSRQEMDALDLLIACYRAPPAIYWPLPPRGFYGLPDEPQPTQANAGHGDDPMEPGVRGEGL